MHAMNGARLLRVVALLFTAVAGSVFMSGSGPPDRSGTLPSAAILSDGEVLVYEVSWTFFKLGTIRLMSKKDFSAEAFIDSYDGLPMVDLHSVHYSLMDSSFFSRASRSLDKEETEWRGLNYVYDLLGHRLLVEEVSQADPTSPPHTRVEKGVIALQDTHFIDGLSIAFFPRAFVHTSRSITVPTLLYGNLGTTTFHFMQRKTLEPIDALEDPVRVVEVDGTTSVEGIFGMTGDFRGWFSDDSAAVPIKGRLRVLLGEVDVELIQWNRGGWNPPQ